MPHRGSRTSRGLERSLAGVVVVLVALLALPAIAAAKSQPGVVIGPLTSAKGYSVTVVATSCGAAQADLSVQYRKGSRADSIDYFEYGKGSCTVSHNLKKATVAFTWPGIASVKLHAVKLSGLIKSRAKTSDCGTISSGGRLGEMGGTFHVNFKGLGALKARKVQAGVVTSKGGTACTTKTKTKTGKHGTKTTHGKKGKLARDLRVLAMAHPAAAAGPTPALSAAFGDNDDLSENPRTKGGEANVSISHEYTPAAGISGSMDIYLARTKKRFQVNGGTVTLSHLTPFASGTLTATALPVCTGSDPAAANATLGGGITVQSPLLGTLTFGPANATSATLGTANAYPGDCNGYGSSPFVAAVDNSCSAATDDCDLPDAGNDGFGENDVYFDDNSTVGTQTVISETVNYGDGSAPVAVSNEDIPDHTYTTAGTFTATVTFVTSDGNTETATTPVFIAP